MFVSAWWYYQRCVLRNRMQALLRGLRQPKYVIGLLLTVAYLGWFFVAFEHSDTLAPEQVRANAGVVAAGYYALQVIVVWFSQSSGRGVAFRQAEVQLLLPRPLTRWQILRFKWLSGQPGALIGSLIIGLMFQRFGGLSYPLVVAGFWINQAVLYANGTLVGLWLARLKARGGPTARWTASPAWVLFAAVGGGVAMGWSALGGASGWDAAQALVATPWLSAVLWPFTRLADLMLAPDVAAFAVAAVLPLAFLLVQGLLIWRADFRFEDQAVEIAERIQNLKSQGFGALQSKRELVVARSRQPWQLAPTGPAWRALVWKNVISLGRLPRRIAIRLGVILLLLAAVFGSLVVTEGDAPHAPTRIGFVLLGLIGYASLLAPSIVRVDLRIDIPHFDVLKAMPLRGRSLIFGEIMGTVVVLWLVQALTCVVAAVLISREGGYEFLWLDKAPALVAALCVFFAVDFALVTSENLLALWLPGFARLGRGVKTGFEHIGQNMLGALIRMLVLMVLIVVPAVVGTLPGVFAHALGLRLMTAVAIGAVLLTALLFAEAWLLICLSEGRYERFDITSENVNADAE